MRDRKVWGKLLVSTEEGMNRDLKEVRKWATEMTRGYTGRTFQRKGSASAKALTWAP